MGFQPILAPALEIRALPSRLPNPTRIQAILITSANALPALSPIWHAHPLFAVGTATATGARETGFTDVRDADADATALTTLVMQTCIPANRALLLLSGRGQGMALANALRAAKFRVARRTVYAAIALPKLPEPARVALAEGRVAHALFFSAETAHAFLRQVSQAGLAERLREIEAISIGQPARMALEAAAWRRIRVAARPTQDAMLACLK